MMLKLNKLPEFASLVARHFASYVELLADEVHGFGDFVTRKVVLAAVTLVCGSFAMALACAWIIMATWDTQWRYYSVGGLWLLFVVATSVALLQLLQRPQANATPFRRLRMEWDQDKQLFDGLVLDDTEPDNDVDTDFELGAEMSAAKMVHS